MEVKNNAAASRYELDRDGQTVFADYTLRNTMVYITHVEAPAALRGTGAAGQLMQGVMEHVRAQGMKAVPVCSYAAAWLSRHKEYADLVHS